MDEHLQTTGKAVPGYDGKKMTNLAELSLVSGTWFVVEPVSFIKQASLDLVWSRVHYLGVFFLSVSYMLKKEEDYILFIFRHHWAPRYLTYIVSKILSFFSTHRKYLLWQHARLDSVYKKWEKNTQWFEINSAACSCHYSRSLYTVVHTRTVASLHVFARSFENYAIRLSHKK